MTPTTEKTPPQDPFAYADDIAAVGLLRSHVAVVPAGIEDRDALFRDLTRVLSLPGHFGDNWDALSDCLRDLSWIRERRLVLFHEDLPALPDDQLTPYLEILREAVLDWRDDPDDELVVVLPPSARERVAALPPVEG